MVFSTGDGSDPGLISGSGAGVGLGGAHTLIPATDSFLSEGGGRVEDLRSLELLLLLGGSFSGLMGFGGGVYSPNQVGPLLGGGGISAMDPTTGMENDCPSKRNKRQC